MKTRFAIWAIAVLACSTVVGTAATLYVTLAGTDAVPPYNTWTTAATNIQDAIDASANGDLILVTNGVYQLGGRTVNGYALTNRVVIDKAVTVESVNGPEVTIIEGYQVPGTLNGSDAVRCVYMTNNATLVGFTLAGGATLPQAYGVDELHENSGGGIWCEDTSSVISNCVLSANAADYTYGVGGGAVLGTFYNCAFSGNSASSGGGAYESVLNNCTLTNNSSLPSSTYFPGSGGGAFSCSLNRCLLSGDVAPVGGGAEGGVLNFCVLTNNAAGENGGAAGGAVLNNCLVSGNSAADSGGGTCYCSITNCSIVDNSAGSGGGSYADILNTCILSSNSATALGGGAYSSSLTNCTLANNCASTGGGADLGTLYNCIVRDNVSAGAGGGINSAAAYNSALTGNLALNDGGGAASSVLASCTLTGNSAFSGGGADTSVLTNCIVYFNSGIVNTNYDAGSTLDYCCTTPMPAGGSGNISAVPQFADDFHLTSNSPCLGAGDGAEVIGVDIDGDPWANPPAIGCDEFYPATATGQLSVAIEATFTNLATGFAGDFAAQIDGRAAMCYWNFGDGTGITNQPDVCHAWATPGDFPVSLRAFNESNPAGVSATITVHVAAQPIQYVSAANTEPVAPYLSWATAATNIQDAVDVAYGGGIVLVTNGVYQSGGRAVFGAITNRLAVLRPTTVESVNGPAVTIIDGYRVPGTIIGQGAVRCVFLADGAELIGFTVTGGATANSYLPVNANGGGIFCQSTNAVVSDCILAGNSCAVAGGGIFSGTAIGCQIVNNTNLSTGSYGGGGGAANSVLLNDAVSSNSIGGDGFGGGGAYDCSLSNCVINGNSMGGALSCILNNCTIENNTHVSYAGGVSQSMLNNCLVCNNHGGQKGGGAFDCTLNSCVVSNNASTAWGGGAFYDSNQTNALGRQNIVVFNFATNAFGSGGGGGVYLAISSNLDDWTFISNSAAGDGGGLCLAQSQTAVNDCTFLGNSSSSSGGGLYGPGPNLIAVSNCTFIANIASGNGGGADQSALVNCHLTGNEAANGGGVYGLADSCIFNDNSAANSGGGLYYYPGLLFYPWILDSAFTNNFALNGGGVYGGSFSNCVFWANVATNGGGGTAEGQLSRCIISDNTAEDGGGAYDAFLLNCLVAGNSAIYGGGVYYGSSPVSVSESTIAGNSASDAGGGVYWTDASGLSAMTNSIIYDNSAPSDPNYPQAGFYSSYYCCTEPLPLTRPGQINSNLTNDPSFMNAANGDFRLSSDSPCINSGNNAFVATAVDLDGNPRIVGGTVDIGAYEFQAPVSEISYAWLDRYGVPVVPGIDSSDLDGTGLTVYQDWIAGLNPTNHNSVLAMLTPATTNNASGITLVWKSVSGITYFLQRSTNLPVFLTIQSDIPGRTNTTSFTDASATNKLPYFYRVGVSAP